MYAVKTPKTEHVTMATLSTMPVELLDRIFYFCSLEALSVLCQLNQDWYARVNPSLWEDIDFTPGIMNEDSVESTRKFFAVCESLRKQKPERWNIIAPRVKRLNLGRLHGIKIIPDGEWDGSDDYIFFTNRVKGAGNVFDMIAEFVNLASLSLYLNNWWGDWGDGRCGLDGRKLGRNLKKLKSLRIGGQMDTSILLGLLARPQNIENLALINLIENPSNDSGPEALDFLSRVRGQFLNLKTLHLCKLADLDGRGQHEWKLEGFASGMTWPFPRESETIILKEWADFLHQSSSTLKKVTIENRYLCTREFEGVEKVNPGIDHPADYGAWSISQSQKYLFPAFSQPWPNLEKVTLIGMGATEEVESALRHLLPSVQIEQRLAGIQIMQGDTAPQQIGTPVEFYD